MALLTNLALLTQFRLTILPLQLHFIIQIYSFDSLYYFCKSV